MAYKFLYEHQFAFQKGKSAERAVLDLYSNLLNAIKNHEKRSCIFLDFAKRFDTINQGILLSKLEYYGIRGTALSWFKSELNKRTEATEIYGFYSNYSTTNSGVPQGSVLGPLIFLIYVNDVCLSAPEVTFQLFVDDTCAFYSHKSLKQIKSTLNKALNKAICWLKANKLMLNVKKSKLVLFSIGKNPKNKENINIAINHEELEQKDHAKYLNIFIDKNLSWRKQIESTT